MKTIIVPAAGYYDPELGRFIQPDTYLDGLNRYAYCHENPVMYVDPSGNFVFTALGSLLGPVGTAIGTILDGACWGATIGAATNASIQGINITLGNQEEFDFDSFWTSVGIAADSGAATAGLGLLFSGAGGAYVTTLPYYAGGAGSIGSGAYSLITTLEYPDEIPTSTGSGDIYPNVDNLPESHSTEELYTAKYGYGHTAYKNGEYGFQWNLDYPQELYPGSIDQINLQIQDLIEKFDKEFSYKSTKKIIDGIKYTIWYKSMGVSSSIYGSDLQEYFYALVSEILTIQ